jgi:iron complex outermembrane receptor protein
MNTVTRILPAALILSGGAGSALAEEPLGLLEEIIVTAEKRAVSVQDVPIAISAFDRDMRDSMGIVSNADIANHTPSMTYNTNPNRVFIRGVGRVDNALGTEPGVAVYRDGVYTNEIGAVADSTFFTDRVEVLRGPQGTLYGRNAVGGAANFISKRPTEEFTGEIRASAYSNQGHQLGVVLSGPVTDKLRYRVGAEADKNEGWVDNIAGEDVNDKNFRRWEVQLDFDVTEDLNIWFQYEASEWDHNRQGGYMISSYNSTSPAPPVGDFNSDFQQLVPNPQFGYTEPNPGTDDIHTVNWDEPGYIKQDMERITAHVSYEFDKVTLKYVYGYTDYEFDFLEDNDKTSRADLQYFTYLGQAERSEQHELQLISDLGGKVEFILGLFYWDSENFQPLNAFAPDNPVLQTPVWADPAGEVCYCVIDAPANPDASYYEQWGDLYTESTAAYGQVDFHPDENWHISVGLRYSKDEKEASEYQRVIFDGQGTYAFLFNAIGMSWLNTQTPTAGPQGRIAWDFTNGGLTADHDDDWSSVDGAIGLDYTFANGNMIFAKVSTGYKSGGYKLGSLQADAAVDEESVVAWELGLKSEFERAKANVSAYYYDYDDMQVPVDTFSGGVTTRRFENAEKASVWGIELELQWAATDALMFYSTYSYMDTEIDTMGQPVFDSTAQLPELTDLAGNELIQSPKHQFSLIADYSWQLASGELKFVTAYVYKDEQWSSIFNRADTQVDAYERTDFRLTYNANDHDLRVTAYVQNAFDEDIIESKTRSSFYYNNQLDASIQPPRIYGVEVNYGF